MNVINRIIMVILLLGLILVLTATLIIPDQILSVVGQFMVDWGQYFAWVDQQQQLLRLGISIGLAFLVDLFLALLIFLEVKPKRKRFMKVEQVSGGKATVSMDSIARQLHYKLDSLPGVVKVTPTIQPKGDKIQARLDVEVTRELAVPQMADQLISAAKQAITDDLGLVIAGDPQVRLKVIDGVRHRTVVPAQPKSSSVLAGSSETADSPPVPIPPLETSSEKEKANWA